MPQRDQDRSVTHLLREERRFFSSENATARARTGRLQNYEALYHCSLADSDAFWLEQARALDWHLFPKIACKYEWNIANGSIRHTWFEDGDYWLLGRIDDVINVSGHRIGSAEVESALVSHPLVAEAAVVPIPHEIKGQGLAAYVTLLANLNALDKASSEMLKKELTGHVRKMIGPIAVPEKIFFTPSLPKTRSGKIMRRVLRKIAAGDLENLGDVSTLSDPQILTALVHLEE